MDKQRDIGQDIGQSYADIVMKHRYEVMSKVIMDVIAVVLKCNNFHIDINSNKLQGICGKFAQNVGNKLGGLNQIVYIKVLNAQNNNGILEYNIFCDHDNKEYTVSSAELINLIYFSDNINLVCTSSSAKLR